jgi:hypothetical protein
MGTPAGTVQVLDSPTSSVCKKRSKATLLCGTTRKKTNRKRKTGPYQEEKGREKELKTANQWDETNHAKSSSALRPLALENNNPK